MYKTALLNVKNVRDFGSFLQTDWSCDCDMQEVEGQLQQEYEMSREQIGSLEDQLMTEKRRRDDAEIEVSKQKQVSCSTTHLHCVSSPSAL